MQTLETHCTATQHHGLQVRLREAAEGAALPVLPDERAQRRDEVRHAFLFPSVLVLVLVLALFLLRCLPLLLQTTACLSPLLQTLTTRRSFLTKSYPTMKKHNPYTPILLREASGTEPKVFARFEFGKEKSISLKGRPPNSTGAPEHRPSPMPLTDTAQVWTTRPLNSTFPSSSRRHEPATPPDQARGKA